MPAPRPLPELASIALDARGDQRVLRLSWHTDRELVVLSLWRDDVCTASFRLAAHDVPGIVEVLQAGLEVLDLQPDHETGQETGPLVRQLPDQQTG